MECDLDVTPLSVGFDLRVQDMAVSLSRSVRSVRYADRDGDVFEFAGTTTELEACLRDAGYAVVLAP